MLARTNQGTFIGRAASLFAAPLGSAATRLAWRIAGVAMVLHWLQEARSAPLSTYLASYPWIFHVAGLGGLLLAAFGPRLGLLIPAAAAWSWVCYAVPAGAAGPLFKVIDEYLLYALLPTLAAISAIVTWSERHCHDPAAQAGMRNRGQAWALRLGATTALGFAALHKLNADFLDPSTSCARLARRLSEHWAVPAIEPAPWMIVALEGLAAPLLWFYPRIGLVWATALAAGLGHIGPAGFNTLVLAAALGFTPERDVLALGEALRRRPLAALAVVAAALLASSSAYQGPKAWPIFAVFEVVLLLTLALGVTGLRASLRAGPGSLRPRLSRLRLPGGPRHRVFAGVALAAALACGASPYLGFNYRYGFAMLSNLRVDDARWNSLVVPRLVRRTASDPFVHVLRVAPPVPRARKGEPVLAPGVFAPEEFRRRFEAARMQRRRSTVELRYQGQTLTIRDLAADLRGVEFAATLPARPLFQPVLTLKRPQQCVH